MKIIDVLTILILGVIILLVIKPLLKRICTSQTCCGEERITDAVNKLDGLSCKVSIE